MGRGGGVTIKVILISHGSLAQSLLETANMFLGETKGADALGLCAGTHPDDFEDSLLQLMGDREDVHPTLILCDLLGGTPFNRASKISYGDNAIKVVYGMNLGMVIHALSNRDEAGLNDLAEELVKLMPDTYGIGEF